MHILDSDDEYMHENSLLYLNRFKKPICYHTVLGPNSKDKMIEKILYNGM